MQCLLNLAHRVLIQCPKKVQRKLRNILLNQDTQLLYKIEFANGEAVNASMLKNTIQLTGLNILLKEVVISFFSADNIIHLILMILLLCAESSKDISDDSSRMITYYTVALFIVGNMASIILLLITNGHKLRRQNEINNRECVVFSNLKSLTKTNSNVQLGDLIRSQQSHSSTIYPYEYIKWGQLQCGQIVCLQRGQECPADLLILDSSTDIVTINYLTRKPCSATSIPQYSSQKGMIIDFKFNLNGTIQYEIIDDSTFGTIKLRQDPKATKFDDTNMIYRGEISDSNDWIYGMALHVGNNCVRAVSSSRRQKLYSIFGSKDLITSVIVWVKLLFCLMISQTIYTSLQQTHMGFYRILAQSVLIFPFNFNVYERIFRVVLNVYHYKLMQNATGGEVVKTIKQYSPMEKELQILEEDENKVLIAIDKQIHLQSPINLPNNKKIIQKCQLGFQGSLGLSSNNILDIMKTDLIVIDNQQKIFLNKLRVCKLQTEESTYLINFNLISERMSKVYQYLSNNSDKLLINTQKCQHYDEMKNNDIDQLISLKRTPRMESHYSLNTNPPLVQEQEVLLNDAGLPKLKMLAGDTKQNQFVSFKKRQLSTKNLFGCGNSLGNSSSGENKQNSPQISGRQKSFRYPSKSQMGKQQQLMQQISPIIKEIYQPDVLLTEALNEQEFIDKLADKDDLLANEILLMLLLCNDITTSFGLKDRKPLYDFSNENDKFILEFAHQFKYDLLYSSMVENNQPDYIVENIIKRVISISNQVKVFEILYIFKPTEQDQNTISVLIRDPESFLLDEGAILYTRYQQNSQMQSNIPEHIIEKLIINQSNERIYEPQLQGLNFVYTKNQLSLSQTQALLKQNQVKDHYEVQKSPIEQYQLTSTLVASIGLKYIQKSPFDFTRNDNRHLWRMQKIHYFQTLQEYGIKSCIVTHKGLDSLLMLFGNYSAIRQNDQLVVFLDHEIESLKFQMKQHLEYLLEQQQIFTYNLPQKKKYIVLSQQALQTIYSDNYLKYHFLFSYNFSLGVGGFLFTNKWKGKLINLLRQKSQFVTSIGQSVDNYNVFRHSDHSFSIEVNNTQGVMCSPSNTIHSLQQFLRLLFIDCPKNYLLFVNILHSQMYRAFNIAFIYYFVSYLYTEISSYYLLIFYVIISNIITTTGEIYLQLNLQEHQNNAQIRMKQFQLIRNNNMGTVMQQTLKTILTSFIDSFIIILMMFANQQLIVAGNPNTQVEAVITFSNLLLIEQFRLLMICNEISIKPQIPISLIKTLNYKYCLILAISIVQIILFQIAQAHYEYSTLSDQYHWGTFILWIFNITIVIGIKFVTQQVITSIHNEMDQVHPNLIISEEIAQLSHKIAELNDRVKEQVVSTHQIKALVYSYFTDKEIIDDQLLKIISNNDNHSIDKMESNLKFLDPKAESNYKNFQNSQKYMSKQLYLLIGYEFIVVCFKFIQVFQIDYAGGILIESIIQFLVQLLIILSSYYVASLRNVQRGLIILIIFSLRIIFKIVSDFQQYEQYANSSNILLTILYTLAIGLSLQSCVGYYQFLMLLMSSLILELLLKVFYLDYNWTHISYRLLMTLFIYLLTVYAINFMTYKIEYLSRYSYILNNRLINAQKTMNDVLGLLMPRFIKERMKKGQISISEDQGEVCILFCDICDFDSIIESEQENIVQFLDNLFRQFDKLCQCNDVQKIETVGKTYMAAAGLKDYDIVMNQKHVNSIQRVLETAIGMLEISKQTKYRGNQDLIIKIGLHYGRVVAGVIGAHKPQFSLIGDTVNTTSRVCSTGQQGQIILSEQAHQRISHLKYQFDKQVVQAKGKGNLNTFVLIQISKKKDYAQLVKQMDSNSKTDNLRNKVSFKMIIGQNHQKMQQLDKVKQVDKRYSLENQEQQIIPKLIEQDLEGIQLVSSPVFKKSNSIIPSGKSMAQIGNPKKEKEKEAEDLGASVRLKLQRKKSPAKGVNESGMMEAQLTKQRPHNRKITKIAVIEQDKQELTPQVEQVKQNYKLNKQVSLRNQIEHSALFRSPSKLKALQNKIDELELPKQQEILKKQSGLDQEFLKRLLKYKVDKYYTMEETKSVSHDKTQIQLHHIYDDFKDVTWKQVKVTIVLTSTILVIADLLHLIILSEFQDSALTYLIALICYHISSLVISIGIYQSSREQLGNNTMYMLLLYLIMHLTFGLVKIILFDRESFEVALQVIQGSAVFLAIQQLQMLTTKDYYRLIIIMGIFLLVTMVLSSLFPIIIFYSIGFLLLSFRYHKVQNKKLYNNYLINQELEVQKTNQDGLLQHLLPRHILNRFISDQTSTEGYTDFFQEATILFADIAGFTKFSGSVEPEQVVNMLRSLFISFDQHCLELNVYKLYTIGDCYVAIGIINANDRDPVEEAANIVLFGLKMIEIVNQLKKNPDYQHLNMRIGAHTGDIIGGVVGTDVVRYDIYGENVTIANKMESNGSEGKMMISQTTKQLLEDNYDDMFLFEYAKSVPIKTKGQANSGQSIMGYYVMLNESMVE